jgi:hypothetical protein
MSHSRFGKVGFQMATVSGGTRNGLILECGGLTGLTPLCLPAPDAGWRRWSSETLTHGLDAGKAQPILGHKFSPAPTARQSRR